MFHGLSRKKLRKHKADDFDVQISEYVFAFEDEASRATAKAALSFAPTFDATGCSTTTSLPEKGESEIFDYRPAFLYTDDTEQPAQVCESEKFRTIFTYSELPGADPILTNFENPVRKNSTWTESGAALILYLLSGLLLILLFPILCWISIKWIPNYERLIVFRLGKRLKLKGPGFVLLLPFCDRACTVRLDEQTLDVGTVSGGTEDQALVEIQCSLSYRLADPEYVCITIKDTPKRLLQKEAQLCLLSSLGRFPWAQLNGTGATQDFAASTVTSLNFRCGSYGIQVTNLEVRDLRLVCAPPPPEKLQKERVSTIQKQLRALSSAFFQRTPGVSAEERSASLGGSATGSEEPVSVEEKHAATANGIATSKAKPRSSLPSGSSLSPTPVCRDVCAEAVARARPLLKHDVVGKALDHKKMQIIVSLCRPQTPLPTLDDALELGENTLFYLDSQNGRAELGRLPGTEPPDVILYMSASDLRHVLRGKLNLMDAMQKKLVAVVGDEAVFNKLRHLLHF